MSRTTMNLGSKVGNLGNAVSCNSWILVGLIRERVLTMNTYRCDPVNSISNHDLCGRANF